MRNYSNMGDQLLNGVYMCFWISVRPIVWIYLLGQWFITNLIKETGNKVIKILGGVIGTAIAIGIINFFVH